MPVVITPGAEIGLAAIAFPQPLNKADRRPAERATRRKRNTAWLRSVSRPLRSLSQRTPVATCAKLLYSSLCSDFEENDSRAIASSAKSGRNKCGKSVCHATDFGLADRFANPHRLARKAALILRLQP